MNNGGTEAYGDRLRDEREMGLLFLKTYGHELFVLDVHAGEKRAPVYCLDTSTGRWISDNSKVESRLHRLIDEKYPVEGIRRHAALFYGADKGYPKTTTNRITASLLAARNHWTRHKGADAIAKKIPSLPDAIRVRPERLNEDCSVICCPNGMVSLANGEILPTPEASAKFHTRATDTPYNKDATHYLVPAYNEATGHYEGGLTAHLETAHCDQLWNEIGHSMWGQPNRRLIFIVGGTGGGKSKLLVALDNALGGDYKANASKNLMKGDIKADARSLSAVRKLTGGARIASVEEPDLQKIDKGFLKEICGGGDRAETTRLYQDSVTEPYTATLFVCSNDEGSLPRLNLHDEALYDRVRFIEYAQLDEADRDYDLVNKMETPEFAQAMLAFVVGCAVRNRRVPVESEESIAKKVDVYAREGAEEREFAQLLVEDSNSRVSFQTVWEKWAEFNGCESRDREINGVYRRFLLGNLHRWRREIPTKTVPRNGIRYLEGWRFMTEEEQIATHKEEPKSQPVIDDDDEIPF